MMNKRSEHNLTAALLVLACSAVLVLTVTAAPATTTMTIPPVAYAVSCDHPQNPHAGIKIDVLPSDEYPVTVQFTDTSTSADGQPVNSSKWDFGDGTNSTEKNVRHIYRPVRPGYFSILVIHSVTTVCGKSDFTASSFTLQCNEPVAGFTGNVYEGFAPLTVQLTDTSQHTPVGVTTWIYSVDNHPSVSFSAQNPIITFRDPGRYVMRQTVNKTCNANAGTYSREIRVLSPVSVTTRTTATTTGTATTTRAIPFITITTGTTQAIPTVSGTGTLSVITSPAGAQVYVDNVMWGASPATIPGLATGAHTLRLERSGYRTMSVPITITDGKTAEYSFVLVPESGGGKGTTPLNAATAVVALAGAGGCLYLKKKKSL
jgi:PKD repeat protein